MVIDTHRPLYEYKIKSSHNSYSSEFLSMNPDPHVTEDLLKKDFRAIELDIGKKGNDVVAYHQFLPFDPMRYVLGTNPLDEFNDVLANFFNSGNNDPLFIFFDLYSDHNEVATYILSNLDEKLDVSIDELLITNSSVEEQEWPTLEEVRTNGGGLVLCCTNAAQDQLDQQNSDKFHKNNEGAFTNLKLKEAIDLGENPNPSHFMRIFPPPDNYVRRSKRRGMWSSDIVPMTLELIRGNQSVFTIDPEDRQIADALVNQGFLEYVELSPEDIRLIRKIKEELQDIDPEYDLQFHDTEREIIQQFTTRKLMMRMGSYGTKTKMRFSEVAQKTQAQMIAVDYYDNPELDKYFPEGGFTQRYT